MIHIPHRSLLFPLVIALAPARLMADASVDLIIVAGQSNALNWHAAAAELAPDPIDQEIPFFHLSGAPPNRGSAVPFNASSGDAWITLGPQRQEPYVKFERDFFGPEITLARRLAHTGPGAPGVIKFACFGTTLAGDWNPAATTGNRLYALLLERTRHAMNRMAATGARPVRVVGFFWIQGETDAADAIHAAAYADNLTAFITAVRDGFSNPQLPFVLARIGPPPPHGYAHQQEVRRAQVEVASRVPFAAWVDTDDLLRDTDHIHLLARGVMLLGERMADAFTALVKVCESGGTGSVRSAFPGGTIAVSSEGLAVERAVHGGRDRARPSNYSHPAVSR